MIELLVVIAIIALLMAVLMPALQRVRKQSKAVICQAHLKQWGTVWAMYTEDNNGYFPNRIWVWHEAVRPYYTHPKICLCPMATKLYSDGGRCPFGAWQREIRAGRILAGSFGLNQWVLNAPRNSTIGRRNPEYLWRTANVEGASRVPLFLDCAIAGATPWPEDEPPSFDGQFWSWGEGGNIDEMRRFCLNRHNGFTNGVFLDFAVRKIGLKELWTFKWHREFDTAGFWTKAGGARAEDWPAWMRRFKDY